MFLLNNSSNIVIEEIKFLNVCDISRCAMYEICNILIFKGAPFQTLLFSKRYLPRYLPTIKAP